MPSSFQSVNGDKSAPQDPPSYSTMMADVPPSYQEYSKSVEQATQTQQSPEKSRPGDKFLLDIPVPAAELAENTQFSAKVEELLGATGGGSDETPQLQLMPGAFSGNKSTTLIEPPSAPVPQIPNRMPLFNHNYTPAHSLTPKRLFRGWIPGIIGQLPDDFLRISISKRSECHHCHHHAQSSPSSISSSSPNTPPIQRSKLRRSKVSSQTASPRPSSVGSRSPRPSVSLLVIIIDILPM